MQRQPRRRLRRTWLSYARRDGREIDQQLRRSGVPQCPCCGGVLEARPGSRLAEQLPLDARGYDLDCRDCRRFWCVVRHTARSIRLVRMRRLAAAVRAVRGPRQPPPQEPEAAAESAEVATA